MMIENGMRMEWTRTKKPLCFFVLVCIVSINGAKIECGGYGCVGCGTMDVWPLFHIGFIIREWKRRFFV